jgi:hypothetical protein
MDARQHNDIGLGTRGLARERQAVADDVGDRVENVRRLIVVRQDDRVALLFEFQDRSDVIGEDRPFEWRDMPLDLPVELGKRQRGRGGR